MTFTAAERIVHQHELPLGAGDVVGEREIAERLAVKADTVAHWHHRSRRGQSPRGFPPARWSVSGLPAWYWPDIAEWAVSTGRQKTTPA